jgi:hypothetical protein
MADGSVISAPVTVAQEKMPESVRTTKKRVQVAHKLIGATLDDLVGLVAGKGGPGTGKPFEPGHGYTLMPGIAKNAVAQSYTDVMMQLKEMYNLGVLNGPDLDLMHEVVFNPGVSLFGELGDWAGAAAAAYGATIGDSAAAQAKDNSKRLKTMLARSLAAWEDSGRKVKRTPPGWHMPQHWADVIPPGESIRQ